MQNVFLSVFSHGGRCWKGISRLSVFYLVILSPMFGSGCSGCRSKVEVASPPTSNPSETARANQEAAPEQASTDSPSGRGTTIVKSSNPEAPRSEEESTGDGSPEEREKTIDKSGSKRSQNGTESQPGGAKGVGPTTALSKARALQSRATTAKKNQQFGKAFELASKAWETVQQFPDDIGCQGLARELASELETLGKAANDQSAEDAAGTRKKLIDK